MKFGSCRVIPELTSGFCTSGPKRILRVSKSRPKRAGWVDNLRCVRWTLPEFAGLSNLVLDEFDRELERRRLCFVRYADDCNIYVRNGVNP